MLFNRRYCNKLLIERANGISLPIIANFLCSNSGKAVQREEIARTPKTVVLLLHHGQPRTLFYAREYLTKSTSDFFKIPKWLAATLINSTWRFTSKTRRAVMNYKEDKALNGIIEKYSISLEKCLNEVIPEFGPISCKYAFLYENPNVNDTITKLIRNGMDRIVFVPLYPNYSCFQTGFLLNAAVKTIRNITVALPESVETNDSHRITPMSGVSFDCSVVDRWGTHPAAICFWLDHLNGKSRFFDSVLFVAPRLYLYNAKEYEREVWSNCQRIMDHLDNKVWCLAWYSGWDQWMVPFSESISSQLQFLQKHGRFHTVVVPINTILPTFDSESILPYLLQKMEVDLAHPVDFSLTFLHAFAELIKNHLLGRPSSAQLSIFCKYCFDKNCVSTREILTNSIFSNVNKKIGMEKSTVIV